MGAHRIHQLLREGMQHYPDPGDGGRIDIGDRTAYVALESGASAETRTVAPPVGNGQRLHLEMKTDGGGDITITFPYHLTTNTAKTMVLFDDAGDFRTVYSFPEPSSETGFAWRIMYNDGTSLP